MVGGCQGLDGVVRGAEGGWDARGGRLGGVDTLGKGEGADSLRDVLLMRGEKDEQHHPDIASHCKVKNLFLGFWIFFSSLGQ